MVSTESDQSSGNRYHGSSPEEERQRTGLFRWDDPENLVPSWSVPPGLMVPGPRQPQADDPAAQAADGQAAGESAADDNSWPGVAPPAGWFLRAPEPPPATSPESASPESASPESASPESASPESAPAQDAGGEAPAGSVASPGPASPRPDAGPWRTVGAVPSPRREPDGSWSSPLTPKPAPRALGATQALYGRAGGPGFQPSRSASPATPGTDSPNAAGPSPWQRSHQLWSEAGIQWEQGPAGPQPRYQRPAPPQPQYQRQAPPSGPPAPPRHAAVRHTRPEPPDLAAAGWPDQADAGWREPAAAGPMRVPLGAPVFSDPGVDEDDGPDRDDRWGDDRPPIWERPAGLVPPAATSPEGRMRANDTLLFDDHRMPGSGRSGPGLLSRRTATIVAPAIVLVAVAVLALALLTGHGPKFGPLTANQHRTPNAAAPQLPLAAVTFDTYPGQQQRGVFQTINRVVAVGSTIVTMGSQTSDGVVRQQFLVSANAGASWQLAPVRAPGGGQGVQAPLGHPAALLAGGPGGWVAVGPQAIWTSPSGLTWTLAATHGISPQLPGDSVWVITKTADGFLAAGTGSANGAGHGATQAVIWTSRDGVTWQRMTAAQLGLAGPGETVLNISYATWRGNATVISGTVAKGGTSYSAAWLSTNGGAAWTRVTIPADHGAGTAITGLGFDGSGLIAVRPGRTASGAADGIAYFSPNGQAWQYSATIDPVGGWTPGLVKGSDYGFVVVGTSASGQLVGYTSTGTGTTWLPTGLLGNAAAQSVVGATVAPAGTIVAVGYTAASKIGQQPVFLEASTDGTVRPVQLSGIGGAAVPEMTIRSTAVAGGVQIAVGSANGYPAVWRKTTGGAWTLVSSLALTQALAGADPGLSALTSVTHGPAWLAVGTPGPVVLTSADGTVWGVAGGNISQDLTGVSAVAATSGPAGYVIVGKLVAAGGSCVADVWWSPNLTSWTRAHDVNDTTGSSQVLAVTAGAHGFVSVGSHDSKPAVWTTANGTSWKTIVLPVPEKGAGEVGGTATAVLQQVAINGNRVVALGQATPAAGTGAGTTGADAVPFAELSVDGGATWQQVPFSWPGPDTTFTALTAAGSAGFAAAGLFGQPGQQDVAVWTSATGATWEPSQSSGLNGSEAWQINALAPSGSAVTGIGTIMTQQSQQTVTFTLPTR